MNKKIIIPTVATVAVVGGIVGSFIAMTPAKATETSPLVDQVNQQQQELNNHEARISANENSITNLQKSTTTSQTTATASPTTTTQTATPTPSPVTVTAYKQIPLDSNGNIDCQYTYSDGTTYQWHWQTVNPEGSWVTDSQGQNGHWVQSTSTSGMCDSSVIGKNKS